VAVFNLFHGYPDYERCVGHIRDAFGDSTLVVTDTSCSNDIVFAWREPIDLRYLDAQSRPARISRPAWSQLASAMERVREAWREREAGV
jgi:hypothetical protein